MQDKGLTGKLFDIKGFSVHDGPGIRITLFLKGCPLRCPWCHSPESQAFQTELNWMEKRCVGIDRCGRCLDACPQGAIAPREIKPSGGEQRSEEHGEGHGEGRSKEHGAERGEQRSKERGEGHEVRPVSVDRSKCVNCGACAEACTAGALFLCGTDYTAAEIMERIRRDVPFFNRSGGGVTISGGECLCQPEFTLDVLMRCKREGIHTAVDTSGFVEWEAISPTLPYTDLYLYDLKGIDPRRHKQVIGGPNGKILDNARRIAEAGGRLHIRIPVIPGYSDSAEVFEEIGRFILELGSAVEAVQILPYHNLGTVKWERLRKDKPIFEAKPPSGELVEARKKQLEDMGLCVS